MIDDIAEVRKPLYLRVRDIIRDNVGDGTWKEGDALPSRRVLAAQLGTTPATIEKAVRDLVQEGLLDVTAGSGTYVRSNRTSSGNLASVQAAVGTDLRLGIVFEYHTRFANDTLLADTDGYVGGLLRGIRSVIAEQRISVTYISDGDSVDEALDRRELVAALFLAPTLHSLVRLGDLAARLPLVAVGASTHYLQDEFDVPCVDSTNRQGSYEAVKQLIDLGHRRIAIICLNSEHCNYHDRLTGYLSAHADAGLSIDPRDMVLFPAGFDGNCQLIVNEWMRSCLEQQSLPTAAFICDLRTTLMVLTCLRESGISIPGDMSVVCFDDSPMFDHTTPLITSIRQPLFEMGKRATERLLARFDKGIILPDRMGTEQLPTQLMTRASVGPPRTDHGSKTSFVHSSELSK